jgi:hypothetical protein
VVTENLCPKSFSVNSATSFFLDQFPLEIRGEIGNKFFGARRSVVAPDGTPTVDLLLSELKADVLLQMMFERGEKWNVYRRLIKSLDTEEARIYAQEVIDREAMPAEEKRRIKAERQEHYRREYLKAQPPTERQLRYLKSLGSSVAPANRLEASAMIDGHMRAGGAE